jgi:hypothetical protein
LRSVSPRSVRPVCAEISSSIGMSIMVPSSLIY